MIKKLAGPLMGKYKYVCVCVCASWTQIHDELPDGRKHPPHMNQTALSSDHLFMVHSAIWDRSDGHELTGKASNGD